MGTITLESADGHTFSAHEAGPVDAAAGIVIVQEIFGVNRHIREVVDRYGDAGYRAVAPAFFDRVEPGVELEYDETGIAAGRDLAGKLDWDNTMADVQAAIDHLGVETGVVGYCWGGTVAWLAASRTSAAASVGYYGGRIIDFVDETPVVPVMLHFGEEDHAIPLHDVNMIDAEHPGIPVHVYPAGHGFNCDLRGSYDAASAALALERTMAFLAENLPAERR